MPADVVGPVCESSDTFARDRLLPPLAAGARVAILDCGAYGSVMSSAYNARAPAAEVMVDGSNWFGDPGPRVPGRLVAWRASATLAGMNAPLGQRAQSRNACCAGSAGWRALARTALLFERSGPHCGRPWG